MKKRIIITLMLLCANTVTIAEDVDPILICYMTNLLIGKSESISVEKSQKLIAKAHFFSDIAFNRGDTVQEISYKSLNAKLAVSNMQKNELLSLQKDCDKLAEKIKAQSGQN